MAGWWARIPTSPGATVRTVSLWAALAAAALALPVSVHGAPATDRVAVSRTAQVSPRSDRWEKRVVELRFIASRVGSDRDFQIQRSENFRERVNGALARSFLYF